MTDKVQKLLSEIATRKLCTMDEHMAFYDDKAKEDYEFLSEIEELIKALQEEPVSEDFEMALAEMIDKAQKSVVEPWVVAAQWKDELIKLAKSEEPVSEELEKFANQIGQKYFPDSCNIWARPNFEAQAATQACIEGVQWQKEHLWKPADGDDLPDIDREVIALLDNGKVVFAHRPPEYWDGKDIITGKVTRNYVERYDKGLWNIPNVKWWLDVDKLPNVED